MNNKTLIKTASIIMVSLIICLLLLTTVFVSTPSVAFAADGETSAVVNYSSVLEDLQKDENFDESDYPSVPTDYSLSIIQLAESSDAELFVYVYQPAGKKVKASSINISTSEDRIDYKRYKLKLISYSGTLFKYKVVDLLVKDHTKRYYSITSIYRPYSERYDEQASGGNTVDEVSYDVSAQFELGTHNGQPYCDRMDIETIVVTDKFVGYVRYPDGFSLFTVGACDSHFVAFSTDKQIDKLLEADVYYVSQSYYKAYWLNAVGFNEKFGESSENYAYLTYTQKRTYNGEKTFEWNRIQTVEEFIGEVEGEYSVYSGAVIGVSAGSELTSTAKAELEQQQWVLRFAETPVELKTHAEGALISGLLIFSEYNSSFVGEVTILRLKFETDGKVYNLGVIDNVQTGSKEPTNTNETEVDFVLDDNIRKTFDNVKNTLAQWFDENKKYIIPIAIAIVGFVLFCFILSLAIKIRSYRAFQSRSQYAALKNKYEPKKYTTSTQVGRSKK
jgi:hypothetical protein